MTLLKTEELLSLRTAITADETRQYIGWAEVIFIDGEMDSHLGENNSGYAITEEIKA